jgi:hypothetical protein
VLARDLRAGDEVLLRHGGALALEAVRLDDVEEEVYNFSVAELQNYAVGAGGVLVHNANEPPGSQGKKPNAAAPEAPAPKLAAEPAAPRAAPGAPKGLAGREGLSYDAKHLNKHLPDTPESLKLIKKEGAAHVFTDEATLRNVEQAILDRGEYVGTFRNAARYGLHFDKPIGYRIDAQGNKIPLYYGELKLNPKTGKYHVVPRTGPAKPGGAE